MNGFWKKKLPAFLLALIMIVGLAPAALADPVCEHNNFTLQKGGGNGGQDVIDCADCGRTNFSVNHKSNGREDGGRLTGAAIRPLRRRNPHSRRGCGLRFPGKEILASAESLCYNQTPFCPTRAGTQRFMEEPA